MRGLPEGVKCLDSVLNYAATDSDYKGLPVFLFGHSWGAYSAGAVLNLHPEVAGAVLFSGFNESKDMIRAGAQEYVGSFLTTLTLPYVTLYERIKFGSVSSLSVAEGIAASSAKVMVVHSKDDETVKTSIGYDKLYAQFKNDERVSFLLYENRGHNYLFLSDEAREYHTEINRAYTEYVEKNGKEYSEQTKTEFMTTYVDKIAAFAPDEELMAEIDLWFCTAK